MSQPKPHPRIGSLGFRYQLILAMAILAILAIGLSVAVGSATLTSRYVGQLRMWQMMDDGGSPGSPSAGPGLGPGWGGRGLGPGISMHRGAPWASSGAARARLSWWDSLRRGVGSIFGLNQATAGLGFTPAESELLASLNRGLLQAGAVVLLLALAISLLLTRRLTGPLRAIEGAVHRLEQPGNEANPPSQVPDPIVRRAPAELAALALSFNQMVGRLADARRQRQNIVADVAHELRTPVTALRSYAEAVQDGVLPADEEAWQTVLTQTAQLSGLVDDLMELTLWEAGQLKLERHPVDLPALIEKAVTIYRPLAANRSIWLTTTASPDLSLPPGTALYADGRRLAQVLHNLLSNALRHTPDGGRIQVSVTPSALPDPTVIASPRRPNRARTARAGPGAAAVEIAVANSGPRLPVEELDRLFERFYRADPSRSRHTGGAGLGLTICRQIVQAHGGEIWAENGPAGPVFRFRLPLDAKEERNAQRSERERR